MQPNKDAMVAKVRVAKWCAVGRGWRYRLQVPGSRLEIGKTGIFDVAGANEELPLDPRAKERAPC